MPRSLLVLETRLGSRPEQKRRTAINSVSKEKLRILIADGQVLFRRGVTSVLNQEPDLEVIAEAGDGPAALLLYETHRPDVVLIDLNMPGLSGLEAVRQLKVSYPESHLIVLTTDDKEEDIDGVLRAGAQAYLLKDVAAEELAQAIRDVAAGKKRVTPAIATKLAEWYTRVPLTTRELEILRLLAEGKSNKKLSSALSVRESTVKTHLVHLFKKLQVGSRTEAVATGIKHGLIRLPS